MRERIAIGAFAALFLYSAFGRDQGDAARKDLFEAKCSDCHNADSTAKKEGPGLKGVKDGKLPSGKKATHDEIRISYALAL